MAKRNSGGYKAPKNFDPNRARAPKRAPGSHRRGEHQSAPKRRFDEYGDEHARGERRSWRDDRDVREPREGREHRGTRETRDYRGTREERGSGSHDRRTARGDWSESGQRRRGDERGGQERRGYQRNDRGGRRSEHGDAFASRAREERAGEPRYARHERTDRAERNERHDRRDRYERTDRRERGEHTDRAGRHNGSERGGRPDRHERPERHGRSHGRSRDGFRRNERATYESEGRTKRPYRGEHDVHDSRTGRGGRGGRDQSHRERFSPIEDVVYERIAATQTSAADVEGLTFSDLGLGNNIVETLAKLGAERPFPIQGATIPDALQGLNVLGRGRTGSGKTIAFGAPLVERLLQLKGAGRFAGDPPKQDSNNKRNRRTRVQGRKPKALILAPTRELALQIDRTVQPIARSVGLYTTQIYGGVPQAKQVSALQMGVDIVIGTPGRMEDLIEQGHLDLSQVVISVLDEADHMCDLGFLEPVQRLLRQTRRDAQILLFSATLDAGVASLVNEFLPQHVAHEVAGEDQASGTIDHQVLVVLREDKPAVLSQLVQTPGKILVFSRTRAFAEQLSERFEDEGVPAVALHGDLNQARRSRHLKQFDSGRVDVLVATDVAARGIHIDNVDLVIQADAPEDHKTYTHRAGRTGRAGKHGTVVTVIPRTRQRRTKELLQRAEIVPTFFGDFVEGDTFTIENAEADHDQAS